MLVRACVCLCLSVSVRVCRLLPVRLRLCLRKISVGVCFCGLSVCACVRLSLVPKVGDSCFMAATSWKTRDEGSLPYGRADRSLYLGFGRHVVPLCFVSVLFFASFFFVQFLAQENDLFVSGFLFCLLLFLSFLC